MSSFGLLWAVFGAYPLAFLFGSDPILCLLPLSSCVFVKLCLFLFFFCSGCTLIFLAFLDFLALFVARHFLAFLSVFPFFPRDFSGSA